MKVGFTATLEENQLHFPLKEKHCKSEIHVDYLNKTHYNAYPSNRLSWYHENPLLGPWQSMLLTPLLQFTEIRQYLRAEH